MLAIVALGVLLTARAQASGELRQPIEWSWLIHQGVRFLENEKAKAKPQDRPTLLRELPASTPWMGTSLGFAVGVQDGPGGFALGAGEKLILDSAKVYRSSRMAIGRAMLTGGRIQPFLQIGFGTWRMSTDRRTLGDLKNIAQYGGGVQIRLWPDWALALEGNHTLIYDDHRLPQNLPTGSVFSVLAALRVQFR